MSWGKKHESALSCYLEDLRPARHEIAEAIIAGHYVFPSGVERTGSYLPFGLESPSSAWQRDLHGFSWIRHFSAGDSDMSELARYYIKAWLSEKDWHHQTWTLSVTARRVISWLTNGRTLTENLDDKAWQQKLRRTLIYQGKYILRQTRTKGLYKEGQLSGACALVLLGLSVSGYDHWLDKGFNLLSQELSEQILPDGGHISRNPSEHLSILFDLLTLKASLLDQGRPWPDRLSIAIDRMLPMLRFFRHGDGRLALFNGAVEDDDASLQAALSRDDVRGRPFTFAPHSGYHRLLTGRTLLLMDTGGLPPDRYGKKAHAGCLSLELSSGKQRFIVNCGEASARGKAWRNASRSTAAHSTLILQDKSSALVKGQRRISDWLKRGFSQVDSHRKENKRGIWLEGGHNGYVRDFDMVHRRRLFLAQTGRELRGEDILQLRNHGKKKSSKSGEKNFVIRFHFHPDIRCGLTQHGTKLIARLPNGEGWEFKAQSQQAAGLPIKTCVLQKQASVYLGTGKLRRSEQLVLEGTTAASQDSETVARVNWVWRRIAHAA